MKKNLQSLYDYNNDKRNQLNLLTEDYPKLNGLSCPKCGNELYDSDNLMLCSDPPQYKVHCDCGYKGYRL